jgi:Arc/MetJ-type ribon-helix-helix transcriptional regulator
MTEEQLAVINREVDSGQYTSASEVVREALRQRLERRIAADVAALERAHSGAWERDTTPAEEDAILRIQKTVRAEMRAEHKTGNSRKPKLRGA